MPLAVLFVPVLLLSAVHLWVRWQERHVADRSPVLLPRLNRDGKRHPC
jgi:hypothetical protein